MKKIGRRSEGNGAKMARKRKQPDQKTEKFPLRLEWRSPAELAENPRNWRVHPENQQTALAGAMTEVGWAGACLYNEATGRLIDGHLRRKVAQMQGCELVPVLVGTWTEEQERKILATLDPLAGMAGADPVVLDELLQGVHTGCDDLRDMLTDLWDDVQADAIAGTETAEPQDAEPQVDRAEELRKKWKTAAGQLWLLGKHRLLCGDSTKPEDVARVMGGERAAIVGDPPYGISVDTSWLSALNVQRGKPACKSNDRLQGDDGTLDLSWVYAWPEWLVFGFPFIARNENYTGLLVWDKRGDGGEGGLGNPVEVAASNAFNGYRLKRHIWAGYVREAGEKREPHPTQKPVGIMQDAIELVKAEIVFDAWAGSGTTLIAAENLSRRCFGIEVSPAYCAVILERYADAFPGQEIRRAD